MSSKESENHDDKDEEELLPERPLECSECKKQISVCYTEIIGDSVNRMSMCADCPELQRRLYGTPNHRKGEALEETTTGLACGNCSTSLSSLRVGIPLGCSMCYEVLDDVLLGEMAAAEKIPSRLASAKKSSPIHIGRGPSQSQEVNPSLRLLALNEALSETVQKEDYEQAAWLRDQIKALTEHQEKPDANN